MLVRYTKTQGCSYPIVYNQITHQEFFDLYELMDDANKSDIELKRKVAGLEEMNEMLRAKQTEAQQLAAQLRDENNLIKEKLNRIAFNSLLLKNDIERHCHDANKKEINHRDIKLYRFTKYARKAIGDETSTMEIEE